MPPLMLNLAPTQRARQRLLRGLPMNAKLDAISTRLQEGCQGFSVRHEYVEGFHSFWLEDGALTHCLYIPWQLVRELTLQSIERLINRPDCIGRLGSARLPVFLCLLEIGTRNVGRNFLASSMVCPNPQHPD